MRPLRRGGASVKHALTEVIFSKLYLDMRDMAGSATMTSHGPGRPPRGNAAGPTLGAAAPGKAAPGTSEDHNDSRPSPEEGPALSDLTGATLLGRTLMGQGPSRAAAVEVPGIEPGSFVASSGLLRAQSATPLLGSTGLTDQPV